MKKPLHTHSVMMLFLSQSSLFLLNIQGVATDQAVSAANIRRNNPATKLLSQVTLARPGF